jgi:hypothetical protein
MMNWEREIQQQEIVNECRCREHQERSGNLLHQIDDCDNAPCSVFCPFKEVKE